MYVWIMTYIYVCGDGRYNRMKTKITDYVETCIFLMGLFLIWVVRFVGNKTKE